jgi:glycerol-3-phosphate dehydrogenase (NAD(P)+)
MGSRGTSDKKPVGVVGAGSFGSAIANILAENQDVILYTRHPHVAESIRASRDNRGRTMAPNVQAVTDFKEVAERCTLIFPIMPSAAFRDMARGLGQHLTPEHILVHGTKGFDVRLPEGHSLSHDYKLLPKRVYTMSEIILEETIVRRVGCLAGPNLASEMLAGQPAATVVASRFDEVVRMAQRALGTPRFQVYGSKDITGIEIAGVVKNVIAIASGMVSGLGLGENARALLISRGLLEMAHLGKMLGGDLSAFFGLAGVGDLVATCASPKSRNYTVGYRVAKGESLEEVTRDYDELAEGVNTTRVMMGLANHLGTRAPLTETVHRILFDGLSAAEGMDEFMATPFQVDLDMSRLGSGRAEG